MIKQTSILVLVFLLETLLLISTALAADRTEDYEALSILSPPVSVKGGLITGEGKDRNAELVVKNDSDSRISVIVLEMLFLRSDGSLSKSVPHTQGGFSGPDGGNTLDRGESYPLKVAGVFIKDEMTAVDGLVTKITFDDKSTWPSLPPTPPEKVTDEPVAVKVIGVLGAGDRARPVVGCFNYGSVGVKKIRYEVEYLDEGGKVLKKTSYGLSSNTPIMEAGAGKVISGGGGPPDETASARAIITSVNFADNSEWKRGK